MRKLSPLMTMLCVSVWSLTLTFNKDFAFGWTALVSVSSTGAQGNGTSYYPCITPDGRYVGFGSNSTNLVANDTNGKFDTFVHDLERGTTKRMSVSSVGAEGDEGSYAPRVSSDGRYVAFNSSATNLVENDTNGESDIFVHDCLGGSTTRISVNSKGEQANEGCYEHSMSSDGRYIAFTSFATNLVENDTNGVHDVFVHDRHTGLTTRASVDSTGGQGNGSSTDPCISLDGRYVAFYSNATNLVANDTNGQDDVFLYDQQTGITRRMSVDSNGIQGNGPSRYPILSSDGRYVAFQSEATNLVPGDTNDAKDIFVHDRQTGMTTRVSVNSSGEQANDVSAGHSISPDGRYVVYASLASNLVDNDTNGFHDIFVHDQQTGITTRVSVDSNGGESNNNSYSAVISSGGSIVALNSYASNLVSDDTNGQADIFIYTSIKPDHGEFYVIPNRKGGVAIIYME